MRADAVVYFEDEDREVFEQARLAGRVGDNDRELRTLNSLCNDRAPFTAGRLAQAWALLLEILRAVEAELEEYRTVAASEPQEAAFEDAGLPVIANPIQMAEIIVETRRAMRADVLEAVKLVEAAELAARITAANHELG